jgi:hypothetical protein
MNTGKSLGSLDGLRRESFMCVCNCGAMRDAVYSQEEAFLVPRYAAKVTSYNVNTTKKGNFCKAFTR